MPANFAAVWKESGMLFPPQPFPPYLVVPYEGLNLVYLNGVSNFNPETDLKYDRGNLTVKIVEASAIPRTLMRYAENFRADQRTQVLGLAGGMHNTVTRGSYLLSIEGSDAGAVASMDYQGRSGRAKMDVVTAKRRTVSVSFRFIRYLDQSNMPTRGTTHTPDEAEKMIDVANRLFLPSANIELTLKGASFVHVNRALGNEILMENFKTHILPLRDTSAGMTAFFVGKWKGTDDPAGTAFMNFNSLVMDDAPSAGMAITLAPTKDWPKHQVTDDEIYYGPGRLERPRSDREFFIVLAHEMAHLLGADHNSEEDNLMSDKRQDLKLSRGTVRAIIGK